MPARFLGSQNPRRVIDASDALLDTDTAPRRTAAGRFVRIGIALGTAGTVGMLALVAPGIALSAQASNAPGASAQTTPAPRLGTTDAFTIRETSTDRNAERDAAAEATVADAASDRAANLDETDAAVTDVQTSAVADLRSAALAQTGTQIDAEAVRLATQATFFWPTEGGISSPWGMRMHPILHYTRLHGGADIGGAVGAPIYAAADGVVTKAATGYNGGSGNNVRIDHGDVNGEALETGYLHMDSFVVSVGQTVKRGELIGYVGNTGLSTASHLHFSVYVNGVNSDPAPYLAEGGN